ncbi:MAG TPA: hypothetical protein VHO02_02365, partial [Fibrobacteria bacterium]|nr:hypothetical protein [Fibrobacteria bacterium]
THGISFRPKAQLLDFKKPGEVVERAGKNRLFEFSHYPSQPRGYCSCPHKTDKGNAQSRIHQWDQLPLS